jgi:hypothetical protein
VPAILLAGALLATGCGLAGRQGPPGPAVAPVDPPPAPALGTDGASVFSRPMHRLIVEFSVVRFSAPRGVFTGDDGLWKAVSGALPSATMTVNLAANGIRAAIGRESDRGPLKEWMGRVADLRTAVDHVTPDTSRVLEVELGPCRPRQAIFYYDQTGAVHGLDFIDARARLKVGFEMRYSNLREIWVEVLPEIEEPPGPPKWVMNADGTARQAPEERKHGFPELLFTGKLPEGGFLLIGPTSAVHERPLLAGPLFLESSPAREGEAQVRESVYMIAPTVRTVQDRQGVRPGAGP